MEAVTVAPSVRLFPAAVVVTVGVAGAGYTVSVFEPGVPLSRIALTSVAVRSSDAVVPFAPAAPAVKFTVAPVVLVTPPENVPLDIVHEYVNPVRAVTEAL